MRKVGRPSQTREYSREVPLAIFQHGQHRYCEKMWNITTFFYIFYYSFKILFQIKADCDCHFVRIRSSKPQHTVKQYVTASHVHNCPYQQNFCIYYARFFLYTKNRSYMKVRSGSPLYECVYSMEGTTWVLNSSSSLVFTQGNEGLCTAQLFYPP